MKILTQQISILKKPFIVHTYEEQVPHKWLWIYCLGDYGRLIQVSPVYSIKDESYFIEDDVFAQVVYNHRNLDYHDPYLPNEWIAYRVDTWESDSDWRLYDRQEDAIDGAREFIQRNFRETEKNNTVE